MKELITRQFLFDFFDGKTTSIQRKLIEEWIQDPCNEEMFYSCVDEWERRHPQFAPNTEMAQGLYEQLLEGKEMSPVTSPMMFEVEGAYPVWRQPLFWIAASVVLLLLTTFVLKDMLLNRTYTSPDGQATCFYLPDSSMVILGARSSLQVPRFGFGSNLREVELEGEAEFRVMHTVNHSKFKVLMGDGYQIEVLGTEFTAYAREEGKRVYLKKGKVKLELPEGKHLYMRPGNRFSADPQGAINVTGPGESLALVTEDAQIFYFDNTPLSEVALQIEERFQIKVKIVDRNLATANIGGVYKASDAHALLEILAVLLELEITQQSDCIELRTIKTNDL